MKREGGEREKRVAKMDHIAAAQEQMISERMKRKLDEVNTAAQSHLAPVQDHINFTLQVSFSSSFSIFLFLQIRVLFLLFFIIWVHVINDVTVCYCLPFSYPINLYLSIRPYKYSQLFVLDDLMPIFGVVLCFGGILGL